MNRRLIGFLLVIIVASLCGLCGMGMVTYRYTKDYPDMHPQVDPGKPWKQPWNQP